MNCSIAFPCHAAIHYDVSPVDLDESNLPDVLFQSLKNNIKPGETYDLSQKTFIFDNNTSYLFIHLNIASLQAHFDGLNEFLLKFSNPPSVTFLSETRIKTDPLININIPGYTFLHYPSSTNAAGVGVYVSNVITFSENQTFRLEVAYRVVRTFGLTLNFPVIKLSTHLLSFIVIPLVIMYPFWKPLMKNYNY